MTKVIANPRFSKLAETPLSPIGSTMNLIARIGAAHFPTGASRHSGVLPSNAVATVVPNTPVHEYFEANPPNYDEFFDIDRCGLIFSAITTIVSKLTPYHAG